MPGQSHLPVKYGINWKTYGANQQALQDTVETIERVTNQAPVPTTQRPARQPAERVVPQPTSQPLAQDTIYPDWMRRSPENDSIFKSMSDKYGKDFYLDAMQQARDHNILPFGEVMTEQGYADLQDYLSSLNVENTQTFSTRDLGRLATTFGGLYMGPKMVKQQGRDLAKWVTGTPRENILTQRVIRQEAKKLSKGQMENIRRFQANPERFRAAWAAEDAISDGVRSVSNVADDVVNTFDDVAKRGLSGMEGYGRGAGRFISTIPFGVAAAAATAGYVLKPHQAQAAPHPEVTRMQNEREQQSFQNLADRFINQLSELDDINQMSEKARIFFGDNPDVLNYVVTAAKARRAQSGKVYGVDRNQAVLRQGR